MERQGEVVLAKSPFLNVEYLGFLMDSSKAAVEQSPTRLKNVRLAINYGFDRTKLMTYLRNSIGTPRHQRFCAQRACLLLTRLKCKGIRITSALFAAAPASRFPGREGPACYQAAHHPHVCRPGQL